MAKDDSSSKIAVGVKQGSIKTSELDTLIGLGTTFQHSEATRKTEEDALKRPRRAPRLNKLQKQIALYERLGRDPKFMPDYPTHGRYKIAIYGKALWGWIGRQPGITCTATEIKEHLKAIAAIMEKRAEMGLDDKISTK